MSKLEVSHLEALPYLVGIAISGVAQVAPHVPVIAAEPVRGCTRCGPYLKQSMRKACMGILCVVSFLAQCFLGRRSRCWQIQRQSAGLVDPIIQPDLAPKPSDSSRSDVAIS